MDIIFLGLNDIGKRIYDWLINENENIICILTVKQQLYLIEELKPDLVLSIGFRDIIPKKFLKTPSMGCINFHKALLPLNRGANPNVWTILEQTTAGVTIHYMNENIDSGPIIAQRKVNYDFKDNARSLYDKLEDTQFELFTEIWPQIKSGQIHPQKQKGKVSYHEKKDFADLWKINLNDTYRVEDFINLLKSLTFEPFNNAYIIKDGKKFFLKLELTSDSDINKNKKNLHIPTYSE